MSHTGEDARAPDPWFGAVLFLGVNHPGGGAVVLAR